MGKQQFARALKIGFQPFIEQRKRDIAGEAEFERGQRAADIQFGRQKELAAERFTQQKGLERERFGRDIELKRFTADLDFEQKQKMDKFQHETKMKRIDAALAKFAESDDPNDLLAVLPERAKREFEKTEMTAFQKGQLKNQAQNARARLLEAQNAASRITGATESKDIQNLRDAIKLLPETIDDPDDVQEPFQSFDVDGKAVLKKIDQPQIPNPERVRLYNELLGKLGYEPEDIESPNIEYSEKSVEAFKYIKNLANERPGTIQPGISADEIGSKKADQAEADRVVQRQQAAKAMKQLRTRAKNGDPNAQKILDDLDEAEGPKNRLGLTRPTK